MSNNYSVYYHVWSCKNDPLIRFLIDEQIKTLQLCGLFDVATINVGMVGAAVGDVSSWLADTYPSINIRVRDKKGLYHENHTLNLLWEDCKRTDHRVMYMHTKGLQHYYNGNPTNVNSWRQNMEYAVCNLWQDNVVDLYQYDSVGLKWCESPFGHYQGNMWWSKSEFIKTLKDPLSLAHKAPVKWPNVTNRHSAEAWIGTQEGKRKCRGKLVANPYKTDSYFMLKPQLKNKIVSVR